MLIEQIVQLYKNCKLLDAMLNRCFASSICKQTEKPVVPVLYAWIRTHEGLKPNAKTIKVLLDSGASATLVCGSLIKKIWNTRTSTMRWRKCGGNFHTEYRSKVQLSLPKFSDQKLIKWLVYVDDSTTDFNYDMIIGQNLLKELGMLLDFGQR